MRPAAGTGPGNNVRPAVAVHVTGRHEQAAAEIRTIRHEGPHELAGGAIENLHVRPAARAGAGDDVGAAVACHVPGGDTDAAREVGTIGHEPAEQTQVRTAEDLDVRPAARAGAGNDVRLAVAVHVAGRHEHTAAEARPVGHEAVHPRAVAAVEDFDMRAAARAGAGDDVRNAVAGYVADGYVHAAQEARIVGEDAKPF